MPPGWIQRGCFDEPTNQEIEENDATAGLVGKE
jgi:hypothetical protein